MDYSEDQVDEVEALSSIYEGHLSEISTKPICFQINVTSSECEDDPHDPLNYVEIPLRFTFPSSYPEVIPKIEIPLHSNVIPNAMAESLLIYLVSLAEENKGMAMVFTLVEAAKEWVLDNSDQLKRRQVCKDDDGVTKPQEQPNPLKLEEPKMIGGRWDFVIGLVGKPSAGKSTFFNAATAQQKAKTAAYPFTTIDPNISKACYPVICPCKHLKDLFPSKCDAAYGHNFAGCRFVPVLLKDVAGLVPGACEGKGMGNRFLNDLLDADVLIHIVDSSGTTDEKGKETENYDPVEEVKWLQEELRQWIFGNIKSKWDSIKRKPLKLLDMFTGYHANKATIFNALQHAGHDTRDLTCIQSWTDEDLLKTVTSFLNIRFPIYLVFNKCDLPTSDKNITRLKEAFPESRYIATSASSECILQDLEEQGLIQYEVGDAKFKVTGKTFDDKTVHMLKNIKHEVLDRYGSTGVQQALHEAVSMRNPTYAFPVQDLDTLVSIDKYRSETARLLRDCVMLKAGTTVEQLYTSLCHYPLQLLAGDFIRAESLNQNREKRITRKDDLISENNNIIKIMTNKKITQVKFRDG